jgi:hypothetical protein
LIKWPQFITPMLRRNICVKYFMPARRSRKRTGLIWTLLLDLVHQDGQDLAPCALIDRLFTSSAISLIAARIRLTKLTYSHLDPAKAIAPAGTSSVARNRWRLCLNKMMIPLAMMGTTNTPSRYSTTSRSAQDKPLLTLS